MQLSFYNNAKKQQNLGIDSIRQIASSLFDKQAPSWLQQPPSNIGNERCFKRCPHQAAVMLRWCHV